MPAVSRLSQPVSFQKSQPSVQFGYDTNALKNFADSPFKIELGFNSKTLDWLKEAFSAACLMIKEAFTRLAGAIEKVAQALTPVNPPHKEL